MTTVDKIALIAAATVSLILLSVVIGPMVTGRMLADDRVQILEKLIMAYIALVAMYMGSKLNRKD